MSLQRKISENNLKTLYNDIIYYIREHFYLFDQELIQEIKERALQQIQQIIIYPRNFLRGGWDAGRLESLIR